MIWHYIATRADKVDPRPRPYTMKYIKQNTYQRVKYLSYFFVRQNTNVDAYQLSVVFTGVKSLEM